jgi:hypothetical protein
VLRQGKKEFCTGVVAKVDFCGKVKRALFHFPKVDARFDEWIEFGSECIARLHTKAPPPQPKAGKQTEDKTAKLPTKPKADPNGACPLDEKNFVIGGMFLCTM